MVRRFLLLFAILVLFILAWNFAMNFQARP